MGPTLNLDVRRGMAGCRYHGGDVLPCRIIEAKCPFAFRASVNGDPVDYYDDGVNFYPSIKATYFVQCQLGMMGELLRRTASALPQHQHQHPYQRRA